MFEDIDHTCPKISVSQNDKDAHLSYHDMLSNTLMKRDACMTGLFAVQVYILFTTSQSSDVKRMTTRSKLCSQEIYSTFHMQLELELLL
jgi:hypothetical protein